VSIVIIRALYTVPNHHVEDTMGLAKDVKRITGVNCVIFLVFQMTIVNKLMITVLKQLVYANIAKRVSGVNCVTRSALLAVSMRHVKGGRGHATDVMTAFGVEIVRNVAVHARVQRAIK